MENLHHLAAFLTSLVGPAWIYIGGTAGLVVILSTIANHFRDPDHDPATPPPRWVQLVDLLALVAARGHVGIGNTRISLPFVASKLPTEAPAPPAPPAALILVLLPLLGACGSTWQDVVRTSIVGLEQAHAEAAGIAKTYNHDRQVEFRHRYDTVKTGAELAALNAEVAAFDAKFAKVVDGFNKAWAIIKQLRTTWPLIERGADPKERAKITGWIAEGLAFILAGKDTLSTFGVTIGGGL